MKPHMQARTEVHAEYEGKRFKVADESVPWSKDAPLYRPNEFTDASVLTKGVAEGWADPPTPQQVTDLKQRKSYEAPISFDAAGMPRNPRGRTGLCGRGLLGRWGPNHAADPIVTRYNPQTGKLQLVAMRREDTGQFAVPGGMSKTPGDMWNDRMRSEFETEVAQDKDDEPLQKQHMKMLLDDLFQGKDSSVVYRGCE
jgi:ADP-ribose pyrophosphatase